MRAIDRERDRWGFRFVVSERSSSSTRRLRLDDFVTRIGREPGFFQKLSRARILRGTDLLRKPVNDRVVRRANQAIGLLIPTRRVKRLAIDLIQNEFVMRARGLRHEREQEPAVERVNFARR